MNNLRENEIHHINLLVLCLRSWKESLVGMIHEVDEPATDVIKISHLRSNVLLEHAKQDVVHLLEC